MQNFCGRDERDIDDGEVDRLRDFFGPQFAGVALDLYDARILLKLPSELADVHVDGVNARRTVLQEAIGESSVGRADIETDLIRGVDRKIFERAFEFLPCAAGEFWAAT